MNRQPEPGEYKSAIGVEKINNILRVVRQREDNYFKVIDFIKKNMETLSKQMEQITIVHKFLSQIYGLEGYLLKEEEVLIDYQSSSTSHCKKLIERMAIRLFEIFYSSLYKIKGTIFTSYSIYDEFAAFKDNLNKSIATSNFTFNSVTKAVLQYSQSKYKAEVSKLKKFLNKIEHGHDIDMKRYYQGTEDYESDKGVDRQDRYTSLKKKTSDSRKQSKDSSRPKKDTKASRSSEKEDSPRATKTATVNKIMKLYSVLDPSRTQFLEDMIYSEPEEVHRNKLLNSLWYKNKAIDEQIKNYYKKVEFMADKLSYLKQSQPKSDCYGSDRDSAGRKTNMFRSEASIKTNNFIICKLKKDPNRKSIKDLLNLSMVDQMEYAINSAGYYSSGAEYASDSGVNATTDRAHLKQYSKRPISKALLKRKGFPNFSSRPNTREGVESDTYKSSIRQMKSKSSSKNNRIFIVKTPTLFYDDTLRSRLVVNTGTITNRKETEPNSNKSSRRPSNKRMSRSVLAKEEKPNDKAYPIKASEMIVSSIFQEKIVMEERMVFDPDKVKQFGARKYFNLRLKKHMKKNMMVSDRLFIEQTNEQINSYNF